MACPHCGSYQERAGQGGGLFCNTPGCPGSFKASIKPVQPHATTPEQATRCRLTLPPCKRCGALINKREVVGTQLDVFHTCDSGHRVRVGRQSAGWAA